MTRVTHEGWYIDFREPGYIDALEIMAQLGEGDIKDDKLGFRFLAKIAQIGGDFVEKVSAGDAKTYSDLLKSPEYSPLVGKFSSELSILVASFVQSASDDKKKQKQTSLKKSCDCGKRNSKLTPSKGSKARRSLKK